MRDRVPGRLGGIKDAYAYTFHGSNSGQQFVFYFLSESLSTLTKENKYTLHSEQQHLQLIPSDYKLPYLLTA